MKKSPLYPWLLVFALLLSPPAQALGAEPQLVIDSGGHKAKIWDVLFTPDGRQLISVSDDKTIRIWDTGSGELLRTLRGQTGAGDDGKLYAGALSPDGRWLAVGGFMAHGFGIDDDKVGNIRLIDLQAPPDAPLRLLKGHTNVILSLAFSPDGQRILSGSADDTARLWDLSTALEAGVSTPLDTGLQTGKTLKILRGHEAPIYAVAFSSPDKKGGARLVTGSWDHTLRLWDGDGNPVKVLAGHTDKVQAAAFTPDGKYLLSGSWDKTIRLWDAGTGAFIKVLAEQETDVLSLSISPDSKKVITGAGNGPENICNVFTIPSGKQLLRFTKHKNIVIATAISPNGQLAATGGGSAMEIYLWDLATGKVRHKLVGKGNRIWSVGFAKDGKSIAWGKTTSQTDDNQRTPFEIDALRDAFGLSKDGLVPIPLSTQNGEYLRAIEQVGDTRIGTANGQIHRTLEILQDGRVTHTITRGSTDGYDHRSLTLTPDGKTVVSGGMSGVITSYDVATGKKRQDFIGHTGDVFAVAPSPDGRFLVSGSDDQTVRLWELATGKALLTLFPASDGEWVAWTPEGYYTASLNGDRLIGWHINQGENKLARYYPAERFAGRFRKPRVVANYLATGGDIDEAIRLANAECPDRELVRKTRSDDLLALAPPMVFIKEPDEQQLTTRKPRLLLMAEARAVNRESVAKIRITVNGRRPELGTMKVFAPGTRRGTFETKLPLDPGENRIAVYAKNQYSESEPEMLFVTREDREPETEKPNLYLLAIGVSDYAYDGDDYGLDLHYADDDAEALTRALKAQEGRLYARVRTCVLIDDEADGDEVLEGLDWLVRKTRKRDISVIFIAGHGMKERGHYYFLPADADPNKLRRSGIGWFHFQDALGRLSGTRWLLADTCHSGSITGKRGVALARDRFDMTDALRDLRAVEGGVVVMTAATGREASLEKEEWGHGAFTKALIEGLAGDANFGEDDGRIDIHELNLYVMKQVEKLTGGRQHPMTEIPKVVPNFPVGMVD